MVKLTLAFHGAPDGGLCFRGTDSAMYNYAHYAELFLGHKSIICIKKGIYHEPLVVKKFKKRFDIVEYSTVSELEEKLLHLKVDAIYIIKYGVPDHLKLEKIPMLIHAVYDASKPHGLVTAGVSKSVAALAGSSLFVPHMIHLYETEENLRKKLNIPENAIVFGRHGGADTWDLKIAFQALIRVLKYDDSIKKIQPEYPGMYFLFAVRPNILGEITHPRLICLESFVNLKAIRKFINTCDAMLHAQSLGETFGISCGEMSTANKPVIVWNGGKCQEHLRILGNKCIKYDTEEDLFQLLISFSRDSNRKDWKAYNEYSPLTVMKQFSDVFLSPLTKA